MKNILLVCTGNTCRSVMAEEMLDDAVDRSTKLAGEIRAESAGTFAAEGSTVTQNTVQVMEEIGLSVRRHKAEQMDKEMAEWADLILTMEASHLEHIEAMFPEAEKKAHTLKGYAEGVEGFPGEDGYDIPDPYGEDLDEYRQCRDMIKGYIDRIVKRLEQSEG